MRTRRFIAAVMAGLLLIFGVGSASTVQAAEVQRTGSTALFVNLRDGIPATIDFHVVKVSGSFFYLSLGESLSNVKYVCPKSSDYFIDYYNPQGAHGHLSPGECLWPQYQGTYQLGYNRA